MEPTDPEVRAMIDSAMGYLAEHSSENRVGGICLVGMAFAKDGQTNHPRVKAAIETATRYSRLPTEEVAKLNEIYSLGIATLFLSDLEPSRHRPEIERLLRHLWTLQKSGGSWGYNSGPFQESGDTSMSQYAILGAWAAHKAGFPVPREPIARAAAWLLRTQDPSGAWGYQGQDPGTSSSERIAQKEISPCLTAAAVASLYLCRDVLYGKQVMAPTANQEGLPSIFFSIDPRTGQRERAVPAGQLLQNIERAIREGNAWFEKSYKIDTDKYPTYYLYTLERYQTFREAFDPGSSTAHAWYDDGCALLQNNRQGNDAWLFDPMCGTDVGTAFSTLFLLRGTRKTLEKNVYGGGRLLGGRGLPKNLGTVQIRGRNVVNPVLTTKAEDLLTELDDPATEFDELQERLDRVVLHADPSVRQSQVDALIRFVAESRGPRQVAALKALASVREIRLAPTFIAVLESGDLTAAEEARRGLWRLQRRLTEGDLPGIATPEARQKELLYWKRWYREIESYAVP